MIKMIKKTYFFENLPQAVVEDRQEFGLRWTRRVEAEIKHELGEPLMTSWIPLSMISALRLDVQVAESQEASLDSLLKNMYGANCL